MFYLAKTYGKGVKMYLVTYDRLAKMKDGTIGNLSQGRGYCYTNLPIENIEKSINDFLKDNEEICTISQISQLNSIHHILD